METKTPVTAINGTVQSVVFQNEENGYTVLRLRTEGRIVTAVGCIPGLTAGEGLTLTGTWTSHPSYGDQFKAEMAERTLPTEADNIYEYLASGVIKGIGAKTAALIVQEFGSHALEIIEDTPEELTKIKGITEKRAREIGEQFLKQAGMRKLMDFLVRYGVKPFAAARLYRMYGDEAKEAVTRNPYILCDEYYGLDFFEADNLALQLGFDGDSPERVEAAVLFELRHNEGNGHVFLPHDKLAAATSQLIGISIERVNEAISDLMDGDYIISEEVAGVEACYLDDMYRDETFVAERLIQMAGWVRGSVKNLDKKVDAAEKRCTVKFAKVQRMAIETAADCGVMVLTGGPGTGKTTTVRGILELFDELHLETLLTAPTGRAAKRLSELTGRDAQTVHRLLGAGMPDGDMGGRAFEKCASDQLKCDAVILDETSMMDISLMAALLDAMPLKARLVMVGDADQLPSVGPGNVFADCIKSGTIPVVRLNEIFRQAQESSIVRNAHNINEGIVPELKNKGGDFYFLQRTEPSRIAETVVGLIGERLPKNMNIPTEDIQVLSPSRKTAAGTGELNLQIQAAVNPPMEGKKEKKVGEHVLRVGDRVMQTRNNYDIVWYKYPDGYSPDDPDAPNPESGAGIYNGDVGYIEDIDDKKEYVRIRFEDRVTAYPFDMLGELELAYAMTVHKSQGSEYRAVVLAIPKGVTMLKTRGVLYTAVTRARELLIITGSADDVAEMVRNDRRQRRYSGLRARLAGEVK